MAVSVNQTEETRQLYNALLKLMILFTLVVQERGKMSCSVAVVGIKPVTPLISPLLVSVMGTQKKGTAVIDDSSVLWQNRADSLIKHRCFSMIYNQYRLSHVPRGI